jgi:hypothetical protein
MPTTPPRMGALMEDPLFRSYMKRVPPAHNANREGSGNPWRLWVRSGTKWLTKDYPTSRRVFYAPPGEWYDQKVRKPRRPTPDNPKTSQIVVERRWRQLFFWEGYDLHWCGRCRRPSYWMPLFSNHHSLRRSPAIAEDANIRCIICGIRWCSMPDITQMERMEPKG